MADAETQQDRATCSSASLKGSRRTTARTRHHTWGIGMAHFDIERLGLEEGEEILPGIVLQADGGVTGAFRVLCDGDHNRSRKRPRKRSSTPSPRRRASSRSSAPAAGARTTRPRCARRSETWQALPELLARGPWDPSDIESPGASIRSSPTPVPPLRQTGCSTSCGSAAPRATTGWRRGW